MGRAEAFAIINAPLQSVWDALNDYAHTPEWVVGLEKAEQITPGPVGVGTIYEDHNRLGPFPQVTPWRVTVFEPMSRQVHESRSAVLPSTFALKLAPVEAGTRLTMTVDFRFLPRLGAFSRLLERLVLNRLLTRVLSSNQANLKQRLEAA